MTTHPAPSIGATRPAPFWRRLLASLGIGLLATVAGSAVGAMLVGLLGAISEGWHVLRGLLALVFYGAIFGPVLAWPVTLVLLPAVWLFIPLRHRRYALLLAGSLAGAAVLSERVLTEAGLGNLSGVMVMAGAVGGLAAGVVFRAFVPRLAPSAPASPRDSL